MNSLPQKIGWSIAIIFFILTSGLHYQYRYKERKQEYRQVITGYYRTHLNREPDEIGLNHWVTWALNKWTLEEVEERGFIQAKQKGAI